MRGLVWLGLVVLCAATWVEFGVIVVEYLTPVMARLHP